MLLNLILPNRCVECSLIIPNEEVVCESCFQQIRFTHNQYGPDNPLNERCRLLFPVKNSFALMQFDEEGVSRKIIHQLKYGTREIIGEILARWVCERLDPSSEKPELLVTVPLHPRKLKERGYNQLHRFGDKISEAYGIPCDHNLIKRNFYRKAQAKRKKEERSATEQLFSITKPLSDTHVLIIDDVFTTGNTMAAVAWEILQAGNNSVSVLVMALD